MQFEQINYANLHEFISPIVHDHNSRKVSSPISTSISSTISINTYTPFLILILPFIFASSPTILTSHFISISPIVNSPFKNTV